MEEYRKGRSLLSFSLSLKDLDNPNILGEKLMSLAGIVFRKHYYASYSEREDLLSVGVLKALTLINDGNFDRKKGTILNFLYTGMRNEMHNYLYHKNKKLKGCETISDTTYDNYFEDEGFNIEVSIIQSVCSSFSCYGDISQDVISEMTNRGFNILNIEDAIFNNIAKNTLLQCNKFKLDLIDRLCGAIIWKNQESFL